MEKTAATIMKAPRKSRECASIPNMVTCESSMIYLPSTEIVYHLEDVGEHDLEAPDDHHSGGAGQGDGPVQAVDAEQPDEGLCRGQEPAQAGPAREQRPGVQEAEAEHRDPEATEAEPEHQHGGVNILCPPGAGKIMS